MIKIVEMSEEDAATINKFAGGGTEIVQYLGAGQAAAHVEPIEEGDGEARPEA
jgi:hypothetical protein